MQLEPFFAFCKVFVGGGGGGGWWGVGRKGNISPRTIHMLEEIAARRNLHLRGRCIVRRLHSQLSLTHGYAATRISHRNAGCRRYLGLHPQPLLLADEHC